MIIILTLFLRVINFSFPDFTTDEARIAYRGYTLASVGKDELGRSYPLVFNSSLDYQLPVTSYITAIGIKVFGKSDFGARIPFILLGCGIIILVFLISKILNNEKKYWLISSIIVSTAYPLILLSKVPNESIIMTFLVTAIFYLLIKVKNSKKNFLYVAILLLISMFTSKLAWFVMTPFVLLILHFFHADLNFGKKIKLTGFAFFISAVMLVVFVNIPQGKRSLMENNFSIISNISIQNGINRLRGQGVESGWPNFFEKIVFNKTHFFVTGVLHWMSQLQPKFYFGQFDESGQFSFSQLGVYSKVLFIPFILGFIYILRRNYKREISLLIFLLILTYPAIFIYPALSQSLLVLTIPFLALIISFGFMNLKKPITVIIFFILILDLIMNLAYLGSEKQNTSNLRPDWVKNLTLDLYNKSINNKIAISDDIVLDIANFIQWYTPILFENNFSDLPYPYKFTRSNLKNIKIIGSSNNFYFCGDNRYETIIVSKRDKQKAEVLSIKTNKIYKNDILEEVAYDLEKPLCIK